MRRVVAAIAIILGTAVVGFSPNRWDVIVLNLPRGHGIHFHDIVGSALIALGIVLFWRAPDET